MDERCLVSGNFVNWPTGRPFPPSVRDSIKGRRHIWNVQNAVSNSLLWARCIKLSLWKFYANDNCNLMKCRKVWSNKAYFEYERNWEKLTWNIKQSYSGLFPIWIGLQRWMDPQQCMRREKDILDILQQLVIYVFVAKVLESMLCLVHWQLTNIFSCWSFDVFLSHKNCSAQNNDLPNDDDHHACIVIYRMSGCGWNQVGLSRSG